jgi:hypothetical protein
MISEQSGPHRQHASHGSIPVERMRWFTGRFVTARDLTDEQRYLVHRRWLINRVLHGEGVLCGLRVVPHEREDCAPTTVWIEPGIALDCCGRELIISCRLCVTWRPAAEPGCEPPEREEKLLAIRYHEEPVDPQYALIDSCTTKVGKEATRIREGVEWKLADRDELRHCWPEERARIHDDCDDDVKGCGGCIEPYCRCEGWVPLAVLTRHEGGPIEISHLLSARLPGAGHLTKITHINWRHGGELRLHELAERHGRLEVHFDRPLREADGDATGINQFTFRVEYGGAERNLEFMPSEEGPALVDRTRAVFTIDPGLWDRDRRQQARRGTWRPGLQAQFVVVTLLCDFILDCHGNPVDGHHLRGRLPSGNGTPGGVFRSWFAVSD